MNIEIQKSIDQLNLTEIRLLHVANLLYSKEHFVGSLPEMWCIVRSVHLAHDHCGRATYLITISVKKNTKLN